MPQIRAEQQPVTQITNNNLKLTKVTAPQLTQQQLAVKQVREVSQARLKTETALAKTAPKAGAAAVPQAALKVPTTPTAIAAKSGQVPPPVKTPVTVDTKLPKVDVKPAAKVVNTPPPAAKVVNTPPPAAKVATPPPTRAIAPPPAKVTPAPAAKAVTPPPSKTATPPTRVASPTSTVRTTASPPPRAAHIQASPRHQAAVPHHNGASKGKK